jgi:hypothetical protein
VSYKASIFMMFSLACVIVKSIGLPSIEMLVDHGTVRRCDLSMGWNGGDGWNPSGDVLCHARIW